MRDKLVWVMSVRDMSVRDVSVRDKSGYHYKLYCQSTCQNPSFDLVCHACEHAQQ